MSFTVTVSSSTSTLFLKGRLIDSSNGKEILDAVNELSKTSTLVTFNLKDLEYINSSGLNTFLKAFTALRNQNKELELDEISEGIKKLFIITKLHSIFTIKE